MADKPTKVPFWNRLLTNNTEPSEAKKDDGWTAGEKPISSSFFNWLLNLSGDWLKWLDDRVFNSLPAEGAVASPRIAIKGIVSEVPVTSSYPAVKGVGSNIVGGAVGGDFAGGSGGGNGVTSQAFGATGAAGTKGIKNDATGFGLLGEGDVAEAGVKGKSITGYGVIAESDTTAPAKSALRLVPQDANPTVPLKGDIYVNSVTDQVRFYDGTSWLTLSTSTIFGNDYQHVVSLARSTTTSATFQTKTTLTTPALTGTYRVGWKAAIDNTGSPASNLGEFRLQNTTDATTLGTTRVYQAKTAACRDTVAGTAEVVFAGVAKTFEIQFRDQTGGNTQGIEDARIEIWRVV